VRKRKRRRRRRRSDEKHLKKSYNFIAAMWHTYSIFAIESAKLVKSKRHPNAYPGFG
jgi:hypothetical protein